MKGVTNAIRGGTDAVSGSNRRPVWTAARRIAKPCAALTALLVLISLARASVVVDHVLPAGIEIPAYAPGDIAFHPGQQVSYTVSWEGLPVAIAQISLHNDPRHSQSWVGEALVSTNRLVDAFYRLRARLFDEFGAHSLASDQVVIWQDDNGRRAQYQVKFDRARGVVETIRRKHDHIEEKNFRSKHPLGPIGGTLLALSQPLKVGDTVTLDVFAATERYVVSFRVARRQQIHIDAGDFDALRVIPSVLYVSDPKNHYKVRQAVIWLSDDKRHLPLRIIADTFVGRIYIDLKMPQRTAG